MYLKQDGFYCSHLEELKSEDITNSRNLKIE